MKNEHRIHYWLMAGQVVFKNEEGVEGTRNMNTLLTTKDKRVARGDLGQTQQAMQVRYMREYSPVGIKIIDVFIQGINHLGHMTEAEFNAGFADMQAEQRQAEADANEGASH